MTYTPSETPPASEITREQFIERFVAEMMTVLPQYTGTEAELRDYAGHAAAAAWAEDWQREEGPEACAQADLSYWGE